MSPLRPLRRCLAGLTLAALLALGGVAAGLPLGGILVAAGAPLLVGLLAALRGWRRLAARRGVADTWLLWGAEARPAAELLAWRASELVSPRSRRVLARSLRRLGAETQRRLVPGALPLNRLELRSQIGLLRALELRLSDLSRPVCARGVLIVERLLTEPGSPLYARERSDALAEQLSEACATLEPLPAERQEPPTRVSAPGAAERSVNLSFRTVSTGGR